MPVLTTNERRQLLAQIASHVAAGLVQRHTTHTAGELSRTTPINLDSKTVAKQAIEVAHAILREADI